MTVGELIEELKSFDPSMQVLTKDDRERYGYTFHIAAVRPDEKFYAWMTQTADEQGVELNPVSPVLVVGEIA